MNAAAACNIERQIRQVIEPDAVVELRAFRGREILSGYYNNPEKLAADAAKLNGSAEVVYFTLNRLDPRVFYRSPNALRTSYDKTPATSDANVIRRILLPIDADPVRPSGLRWILRPKAGPSRSSATPATARPCSIGSTSRPMTTGSSKTC